MFFVSAFVYTAQDYVGINDYFSVQRLGFHVGYPKPFKLKKENYILFSGTLINSVLRGGGEVSQMGNFICVHACAEFRLPEINVSRMCGCC